MHINAHYCYPLLIGVVDIARGWRGDVGRRITRCGLRRCRGAAKLVLRAPKGRDVAKAVQRGIDCSPGVTVDKVTA